MTNPAEFLAAALDAAEVAALATFRFKHWESVGVGVVAVNAGVVVQDICEPSMTEENATFVALNDPAHVLNIIAAHRVLLDDHNPDSATGRCRYCHYGMGNYDTPCWTLKLLAGAYGWVAT